MNLRPYSPDFVAVEQGGTHWLLETKGWRRLRCNGRTKPPNAFCEDATSLTGTRWRYLKGPQKLFEQLQAATSPTPVATSGSLL
jgi:type III restriction enzyme